LRLIGRSPDCSLYQLSDSPQTLLASTPQSRSICNDPLIYGLEYTESLKTACHNVLQLVDLPLVETETTVVHLLRGGLNFGLRQALGSAYGWNKHGSCFLSAQRHRVSNSEDWRIAESEYRKFAIPSKVSLVLGDVVASGTSLQHALLTMIDAIKHRGAELCSILFFTIGGHRSEAVFQELEERILAEHPNYKGSTVIYFEGRFPVASPETPLRIKLTGTDLLRHGDTMAPEFLESQYQNPMFPVERCTIYDAGSRAFEPEVYLEDVLEYWKAVLALDPLSFADYLAERCPLLDPNRFQNVSLRELAASQVQRIEQQRAFFSH